jgi:hypothetical protein
VLEDTLEKARPRCERSHRAARTDFAARAKRNASVDRGATLGLRLDRQRSLHKLQSFLHADEANPSTRHGPCTLNRGNAMP